jgi:hypothetical protein
MLYRQLPEGVCVHLMAKMLFYAAPEHEGHREEHWNNDIYWCNETQRPIGLDGGFVHVKECTCARSCHMTREQLDTEIRARVPSV